MAPRIMESKKDGVCNDCRGAIVAGELITWSASEGARHYKNADCVPQVATDEQKAAFLKALTAQVKAWDGKGTFRTLDFATWIGKDENYVLREVATKN